MKNKLQELPSFSILLDRQLVNVFQNAINAGYFTTFCHCWRPASDNSEILESPPESGRFGNYALTQVW